MAQAVALTPGRLGVASLAQARDELGILVAAPGDLHVTLSYLGEVDDLRASGVDLFAVRASIEALAGNTAPIPCQIAGLGRFTSQADPTAPHPLYLGIDAPGLTAFVEQLRELLTRHGLPPNAEHGFTPHCTLAYLPRGAPTPPWSPPPARWVMEDLTLMLGDEHWRIQFRSLPMTPTPTQTALAEWVATGVDDAATLHPLELPAGGVSTRADANADGRLDKRRRDAILAAILAAFSLSADDISQLGLGIYQAQVSAYLATLRAQVLALGLSLANDWAIPDSTLSALAAQALAAAESVATTLAVDLRQTLTNLLGVWDSATSSAALPASALQQQLTDVATRWSQDRATWKADQIAQVETSNAAQQAHDDLAHALQASQSGDDVAQTQYGDLLDGLDLSGVDPSQIVVAVLPDYSSIDDCADYAGNVYPLDSYDDLPDFPQHISCIHQKVLLLDGGAEYADD